MSEQKLKPLSKVVEGDLVRNGHIEYVRRDGGWIRLQAGLLQRSLTDEEFVAEHGRAKAEVAAMDGALDAEPESSSSPTE